MLQVLRQLRLQVPLRVVFKHLERIDHVPGLGQVPLDGVGGRVFQLTQTHHGQLLMLLDQCEEQELSLLQVGKVFRVHFHGVFRFLQDTDSVP